MTRKHTVIAANEGIAPAADDTSLCNFFTPFKGDIHVAVDRLQVA